MDAEYKKYLLSKEWAQLRIDLFNFRGYKCEKCNSKKRLQVHHLNYDNIFNENPKDLIILCHTCHKKAHGLHKKKPKKIKKLKVQNIPPKPKQKNIKKKSRFKSKTVSLKYSELVNGGKIINKPTIKNVY